VQRLLYVAFAGTDQLGVHRKIAEQCRALRAHGVTVDVMVFADLRVAAPAAELAEMVCDLPGGGFDVASRMAAIAQIRARCDRCAPDVIYMRYPMYDRCIAELVATLPPVVFELQTIIAHEIGADAAREEAFWASTVLGQAAGVVAVTSEILAHEQARAPRALPGLVMPNGAEAASIAFAAPSLAFDRVDALCVASFYHWHGVDRVVVGMAAEPDVTDLHLHLVGDGPLIAPLRTLVREANLESRVHFHGRVPVNALAPWYACAQVAVGSLAPHRVGLRELAALKHREYAFRGLPMVIGGADADLRPTLPWVRAVSADDSPVSPRVLRALALAWRAEVRRRTIRRWAETHLTWDARMPALLPFLATCAAHHAAVVRAR
jgi:glycosyltransferase involved in cell wall biosynthesis